ncbi:MAG: TonB-dependent receptor [Deltaproteobacteria bacterium]|nr:TonB-dependent receptor [Deltaproteobacteria bacterium]
MHKHLALASLWLTSTIAYAQPTTEPASQPASVAASQPATGVIKGRVTDKKTKEGLIEATVKVTAGTPDGSTPSALTDVDGNFELTLPAGRYELRVYYELYKAQKFGDVVVTPGKPRTLNVALTTDQDAVEEVVVVAKADRRSQKAVIVERQKAAVVSDAISAQEIQRTPDNSASEAMKRVVSATVTEGKYVVVRGLGGRYSTTLLNNADLPSPEPDEQAVPLDLFPTTLLANMTVLKTYSPELPGAFSGGTLQIETNAYPEKRELRLRLQTEYNTEATFRRFNGTPGATLDGLGFDNGRRALPQSVPRDRTVIAGNVSSAEQNEIAKSFRNVWTPRARLGLLALGITATYGDTQTLGKNRLGYTVALRYAHNDQIQRADVASIRIDDEALTYREQVKNETATEQAALGALVNLGLELGADHELNLFQMLSHGAEASVQTAEGYNENDGLGISDTRLRFITRTLSFTQIRGMHRFSRTEDGKARSLGWFATYAYTARDEPDTRDTSYNVLDDGTRRLRIQPGSLERLFSTLGEHATNENVELTLPFQPLVLKVGARFNANVRAFSARRFRFVFIGDDPSVLQGTAEEISAADNVGGVVRMEERTLPGDAYDAALFVGGVYANIDVTRLDPFRINAGVRVELARQTLTPNATLRTPGALPAGTDRLDADVMPALNLSYAFKNGMQLRAAYGYTVSRPRFRELAPFIYFDYVRRRALSGNPALNVTHIHNVDVRWEWFPMEGVILAASGFYKYFSQPIERVIANAAQGDLTFANADGAHLAGAELEARTGLGFLSIYLQPFYVAANFSLMFSRVQLGSSTAAQTSSARPLQGQSPYVANASIGYSYEKTGTEVALLYNVYGPRIVEVGVDRLPDVYEQPFHRLDFAFSQRFAEQLVVKVTAQNIAYQRISLRQGPLIVQSYQPGFNLFASLQWQL